MKKRNTARKAVAALASLAVIISACGSDDVDLGVGGPTNTTVTSDPGTDPTTTAPPTTPPTEGAGWIDGEPEWSGGGDGDEFLAAEAASGDPGDDTADFAKESEAPIPVEPDGGIGDGAEPLPFEEPPNDSPLRAGSVDDNADYQGFLDYLERIEGLGIPLRDFDPSGRSVVTVTGSNGLPVSGVEVVARVGDVAFSLRTTADGTARFAPSYLGDVAVQAVVDFSIGDVSASAAVGTDVELTIAELGGADAPVALDILFLLDATGSMGDEIDRLKTTIDTVAARVALLDPAPDVRFAMTLYRDEQDAFVTANYDFTGDVEEFRAALADVVADGGGDYPEALDEGLADALAKPSWRDPANAVQLVFVVADAPPQIGRQVPVPYTDSIREAVGRGIKIFPVASSESDDQAEAVFRLLAQATGAPFVFLSNGANGASIGESSDIQTTDYEELALDELVVRLVAEELSDLNGSDSVVVPTTVAPETTNPEGQ